MYTVKLLSPLLLATLFGCAQMPGTGDRIDVPADLTTTTLRKFSGEQDFAAYRARLHEVATEQGIWWAHEPFGSSAGLLAQNESDDDCPPDEEGCGGVEEIVTTGSRVLSSAAQSITNNQERGVDEGDIVKKYKNFLIVLQHGRLFSIDVGNDASALRYVDRIDVYTTATDWTWYDELLIAENKLVVTGFNYDDSTTEISVFEISDAGVFTHLTTYFITSEDYYSSDNYATRMVDGHLVIYTPLYMVEYDVDEGIIFPLYRQQTRDGQETFWQPLFSVTDVYWPIQETLSPVIHTISICPITTDDGLSCQSTGIVGPAHREFYVSNEDAYIWNARDPEDLWELDDEYWDDCAPAGASAFESTWSAALYRIPLFGGEATAVKTTGVPLDQFSLDARASGFHALLSWPPSNCWDFEVWPMRYLYIGNSEFARMPPTLGPDRYAAIPSTKGYYPQNRFGEDFVAYTDTTNFDSGDPWQSLSDVIVVPLADPLNSSRVRLGFDAERLELLGKGLVATGTLNDDGLHLSTISTGSLPRVADRQFLLGYFESEGRSHAFNLKVDDAGRGMFGIPVAPKIPYRHWSILRDNSDIAYFSVDESLQMTDAGLLQSSTESGASEYKCEVSCYDWYGNARPIFIGDRIFALSGSELIEGSMVNGQITEIARVTMLAVPEWQSVRPGSRADCHSSGRVCVTASPTTKTKSPLSRSGSRSFP